VLPWNAEVGGGWIGWSAASKPLVVLSIHRDQLIFSSFRGDYVFPKENIMALVRCRFLFSVGLRIHHNLLHYPDCIVFWIAYVLQRKRFARFKEKLEAFGYEVKE
jgi:hypothetical protein